MSTATGNTMFYVPMEYRYYWRSEKKAQLYTRRQFMDSTITCPRKQQSKPVGQRITNKKYKLRKTHKLHSAGRCQRFAGCVKTPQTKYNKVISTLSSATAAHFTSHVWWLRFRSARNTTPHFGWHGGAAMGFQCAPPPLPPPLPPPSSCAYLP